MAPALLDVLVLIPAAAVVVALFSVMWRERTSVRETRVAVVSGLILAGWATTAAVLAYRSFFTPPDLQSPPPIGFVLGAELVALAVALAASPSLRHLLTNQRNLIRLNLWRLEGFVFLMLMSDGQMPALWALPAGIGDIVVGALAFPVASGVETPGGRGRAIFFNFFGLLDLIVAVGLGITTSPGPAQVFHTTPTSQLVTHFPLALVPTFLVPLAFMLHIVSLWQLIGGTWAPQTVTASVRSR